jgi:hypothetical protein
MRRIVFLDHLDGVSDLIVDFNRGPWILCFDVVENRILVGERTPCPDRPHDWVFALREATSRRSAKCASTVASSTSGRLSSSASRSFARNHASCASPLLNSSIGKASSFAMCQQNADGVGDGEAHIACFFTSASIRVWTKAFAVMTALSSSTERCNAFE